jgi:hypothetical protein
MKKLLPILLFHVILTSVSAKCPSATLVGLTPDECYTLSGRTESWRDADQTCQKKQGHLASVTSATANYLVQTISIEATTAGVWIGGHYETKVGRWLWVDGKRWSYTNWASGQPKRVSGDNCLSYNATSGQWSAAACATQLPYLCKVPPAGGFITEAPLPPSLPTIEPMKCPMGWITLPSSVLCYQAFPYVYAWSDGADACSTYNGKLVSITSRSLQEDINSQFFDACGGGANGDGAGCWIGLYSDDEGIFYWSDGSFYNYTSWESGQPSDNINALAFLDVQKDGQWSALINIVYQQVINRTVRQ